MLNNSWEDSWKLFVAELDRQLQSSSCSKHLAKCFGGRHVTWEGIIEQIDIDDQLAMVDVALPSGVVHLPHGGEAILDGLTLSVTEASTEKWQTFSPGDRIVFSATLGESDSPFSPIELTTFPSGKNIVTIRAVEASPVV